MSWTFSSDIAAQYPRLDTPLPSSLEEHRAMAREESGVPEGRADQTGGGRKRRRLAIVSAVIAVSLVAAIGVMVAVAASPGIVLILTALLAVLLFATGWWLAFAEPWPEKRDLGIALISGAVFTLAVVALQGYMDLNTQRVEEQRQKEAQRVAQRETVELAIATTSDLSGFDPRGRSLRQAYLAGKTLDGAQFEDADLQGAVLRDASLRGANLKDANLKHAKLINTDLSETVLDSADLHGAELRIARFEEAQVSKIESLRGAIVDARTCWPDGFLDSELLEQARTKTSPRPGGGEATPSSGHVCNSE